MQDHAICVRQAAYYASQISNVLNVQMDTIFKLMEDVNKNLHIALMSTHDIWLIMSLYVKNVNMDIKSFKEIAIHAATLYIT